jgi:hypothetical protein
MQDVAVQGVAPAVLLVVVAPAPALELDVALLAQQTSVTPPSTAVRQHVSPGPQATPPHEAPDVSPALEDVDVDKEPVLPFPEGVPVPKGALALAPQPTTTTPTVAASANR